MEGPAPPTQACSKDRWRLHQYGGLAALARGDPDQQGFAVDGIGSESNGFGVAQAGGITGRQDDAALQVVDGRQEVCYLLPAQYDRHLFGLFARRRDVLDRQGTLECDGVEEPQGRHRDDDGTGGKVLVGVRLRICKSSIM
jgi:hypothetical protein